MMDTVTHAIIGAVTASACTKIRDEKPHDYRFLWVTALAAAFPDIDYLWFWTDPYRFITEWHRGITHSLVLLPLWAGLLSTPVFFVMKRRMPFGKIFGYCALGLSTHIVADWITLYGVKIFAPLSDRRFALSLAFDMDPWIGLLAFLGLIFGVKNRRNAFFGIIAIGAYLGLMVNFQQYALSVIDDRTRTDPIPVDKVYALPQPFIPFHWRLVIDRHTDYETAGLSLFGKATHLMEELFTSNNFGMSVLSATFQDENDHAHLKETRNHIPGIGIGDFRAVQQLRWQRVSKFGDTPKESDQALAVWRQGSFSNFRKFSSLPVLYRIDNDPGSLCIWYTDWRYIMPLMKPPFRYGMCRVHPNKSWQLYRLRRNTENSRQLLGP